MYFSYQKLLNNENSLIMLISEYWTVKAYLTNEIRLGGRADFKQTSSKGEGLVNTLYNEGTSFLNSLSALVGMDSSAQSRTFKTGASSMVNWVGTQPFDLGIEMVFLATSSKDDVRIPVQCLMDATYPSFGKAGFVGDERPAWITSLRAPLDYQRGNYASPKGVLQLRIGKWFKSSSIFIVTTVDPTFSKETTKDGKPLFCTMSVRLQPYRDVCSKEVKKWMGWTEGTIKESKYVSAQGALESANFDEISDKFSEEELQAANKEMKDYYDSLEE